MATVPRSESASFAGQRALQFAQVQDLLLLQKAAQKISSILDLDQLIDKVVNEIARSFGCAEANIYLIDEEQTELVLAGVCGCHVHAKGHRLKIGKEGMVGYVAGTRQMRYAPDVTLDPYYIPCEHEVRSEVAIPLEVEGRMVGVFTASHPDLDAFPPEQIRLLQGLADHIAVAVRNASLMRQERLLRESLNREAEEARAIQDALFPKSSPFIPGFAVSGMSVPAGAVGGDWYDFLYLNEHLHGLVLADVSGKGMPAALLMSATRGMLRSLAEACTCPAKVLTKLNRLLVEDFPRGKFVTMVYGVLDSAKRTLTFASAGHLRPLLVDSQGARFLETQTGLPLGLTHGEFSERKVILTPGARLIFYSDGITEAENSQGEEYGEARLLQHVIRPDACCDSLLREVQEFAAGSVRDDATVIFVRA
jgi:sigma-B regulation protein RsbU (phosphoserine phosphatase)